MVAAAVRREQPLEVLHGFPVGSQEQGAGRFARAKQDRDMVWIPIGPPGRIRDEQTSFCAHRQLNQIAMGYICVLADFQPPPRMGEIRIKVSSPNLEQLLLRPEDGRDRSVPSDQVLNHAILHHRPAGVGLAAVRKNQCIAAAIDDQVARSRGVPVRVLGYAFMVIVGITAAEATQAIGALLLLGLLAAPAATARHLTARPFRALTLSGGVAVLAMWIGLTIAYAIPRTPPSFAIVAVATAAYTLTRVIVSS